MRKILLSLAFLAGCIGTTDPHNPLRTEKTVTPWWAATTVGVPKTANPWERYNQSVPRSSDDPWATFQHPELFPKDFKVNNAYVTQGELINKLLEDRTKKAKEIRELKALLKQLLEKESAIIPRESY